MSIDRQVVNTIKGLSMDAVERAGCGHPGMPMGMADATWVLWSRFLKHDPSDPEWPDRDRFVLSAGHGSMLLYSLLHLTGYELSLDDLKDFRQWGSKTPGHPEYGHTVGVETTTGPLGQGFANAVGMALSEALLRERFGADLVDHFTYAIAGDGDLMEGVSAEAASLAGTLQLGRCVVLYDDNNITIDGRTDIAFTEDVAARFRAYGWHVQKCDGHDHAAVEAAIIEARADDRPSLICCKTIIGHGAPNKQDTSGVHGAKLGAEELRATKLNLGMDPEATFVVSADVLEAARAGNPASAALSKAWAGRLAASSKGAEFKSWHAEPDLSDVDWPKFEAGGKLATRKASQAALNAVAAKVPQLFGGSADLAGSNGSMLKGESGVSADNMAGRNLFFGVREHAMGAICNGMVLHGGMRPYCATFLVFHDYMRPAVRLACLMNQPVIYIYTHDSFYLGEDGPTHQPVEHLMSMRIIPNMRTIRPADATETAEAWKAAISRSDGPTALVLTRQGLPILDRSVLGPASGVQKGGYVLAEAEGAHAVTLIATGSEVDLALRSRAALQAEGLGCRVVSLPCWELFEDQGADYIQSTLGGAPRIAIEAGRSFGWERWVGANGAIVGWDGFGASAPAEVLGEQFGFTVSRVVELAKGLQ